MKHNTSPPSPADDSPDALSRVRQQIRQLHAEQLGLLHVLMDCGPMIMGSMYQVFRKCSKAGCRCTKGQPHGPFMALSYSIEGKHKNKLVRRADVPNVKQQASAYRRFQDALMRWRELSRQIDACVEQLRSFLTKEYQ